MCINNGVFPGKAADGTEVITIVDFEVLGVVRDPVTGYLFNVRILSDPCTYNSTGEPVFLRERGSEKGL